MPRSSSHLVAALALVIQASCASNNAGIPVAGLYSAAHQVEIEGGKITTEDYFYIGSNGEMRTYVRRFHFSPSHSGDCFMMAGGSAVNAGLQGGTLSLGVSPSGEPAYVIDTGDVTFGVLIKPTAEGNVKWFVRNDKTNSIVNVIGLENTVNAAGGRYSISGPPLTAIGLADIESQMCDGK